MRITLPRVSAASCVARLFVACMALASAVAACSTRLPPGGEVMLVVRTDMSVPKDFDFVQVQAYAGDRLAFSSGFSVGAGAQLLPATLGLKPPVDGRDDVRVRVVSRQGGATGRPRHVVEAVTRAPSGQVVTLPVDLGWLCVDAARVSGSGEVESTCGAGRTCVSGRCEAIELLATPDLYASDRVFGGGSGHGDGACFDTLACFAGGKIMEVDRTDCSVGVPADARDRATVALVLPPGSEGICGPEACLVPLDAPADRGTLERRALPPAVCTHLSRVSVAVTTACEAKTAGLPTCGSWSAAGSVSTDGLAHAPQGFVLPPPSCTDGIRNGLETDVDCGADCAARCAPGRRCGVPSDCDSGSCVSGTCRPATCFDGVKNASETDVDCGGACETRCGMGQHCGASADCAGHVDCIAGTCSTCAAGHADCDGASGNGCEADLASSPTHCGSCGVSCLQAANASGGACVAGKCSLSCVAPYADCNVSVVDGCEVDTSNDASHCGGCTTACARPSATGGQSCTASHCVNPTSCASGSLNCDGDWANGCEVSGSALCKDGDFCLISSQCADGSRCSSLGKVKGEYTLTCYSSCFDGFQNGGESDLDCGGVCAPRRRCLANMRCLTAADCVSGVCTSGACQGPDPPRPLAPLSTALVSTRRPILKWALPAGVTGARVEMCANPACTAVAQTYDVAGTSLSIPTNLPVGVTFWRLRGLTATSILPTTSAIWSFSVGYRNAPISVSWSSNGDYDGDGYSDLAVGAPFELPFGRVYLYHGGPAGLSSEPWRVVAIDRPGFGSTLRPMGDVNGDGYGDMLVGAYSAGEWFVLTGGPAGVDPLRYIGKLSPTPNTWYGYSTASLGDVTGDGYADMFVGWPRSGDTGVEGSTEGRASVLFGGAFQTGSGFTLSGVKRSGDFLGIAVAGADFNGDGFADMVVGTSSERYFTYLGRATGIVAGPAFIGAGGNIWGFASALASGFDSNGDGYPDLVVGVPRRPEGGGATILLGTANNLSAQAAALIIGDEPGSNLGSVLSGIGDVNGDGYDDIALGAPQAKAGRGEVRIHLGSAASTELTPILKLTGTVDGEQFGSALSSGADYNNDGYADLAVTSVPAASSSRTNGKVSIYYGGPTGLSSVPALVIQGANNSNSFGSGVASKSRPRSTEESALACLAPSSKEP